jgi:hypothetical protein
MLLDEVDEVVLLLPTALMHPLNVNPLLGLVGRVCEVARTSLHSLVHHRLALRSLTRAEYIQTA